MWIAFIIVFFLLLGYGFYLEDKKYKKILHEISEAKKLHDRNNK